MQQTIRYTTTDDGVRLAWARAGSGPPLVKASNWLTHLEFDLESPVWRHWVQFLADHFEVTRYDERGCGMSDWKLEDDSSDHWIPDFEAVIDASKPDAPFVLLAISQGGVAAIDYAIRYPERVSHLILYGAYARGSAVRKDSKVARLTGAIIDLTQLGWGQDDPVYRQLFTSRFIPEGTQEQFDWFNELCRRTTAPDIAYKLLRSRVNVQIVDRLKDVRVPTLVLHADRDEVVSLSEGKLLASEIPDAEFVQLYSRNHVLLDGEPAWQRFKDAVLEFTGVEAAKAEEDPVFETLTPREREILAEISLGLSNVEVGAKLFISEKTVRNNLTKIFEKLGVSSRAQAIVMAKDGNLSPDPGER